MSRRSSRKGSDSATFNCGFGAIRHGFGLSKPCLSARMAWNMPVSRAPMSLRCARRCRPRCSKINVASSLPKAPPESYRVVDALGLDHRCPPWAKGRSELQPLPWRERVRARATYSTLTSSARSSHGMVMRWKIAGSVQPLASRPIWPPAGLIHASFGVSPLCSSRSMSAIGTLRVVDAADHQQRRHRAAEDALRLERRLGARRAQIVERLDLRVDGQVGGDVVEEILLVAHRPLQRLGREGLVDRRRLRDHRLDAIALGRREDGRPIAAEAAAIDGDAALVDLWRGEHGVDEARQHALGARPPRSRPRGGALTRRRMYPKIEPMITAPRPNRRPRASCGP